MNLDKLRSGVLLSFVACVVGACIPFGDPEGPGVSGSVSMSATMDTTGFTTLHVTAIPDDARAKFDTSAPVFTAPPTPALDGWGPVNVPIAEVVFPYSYNFDDSLGTTPHQHWRLFAWLSKSADATVPTTGDFYGTAEFDLNDCGSYGDYCQKATNVDFTIENTAP